MSQQDSTNPAYNLQLTYHFNGAVDYDIFNKSVGLLFDRHLTMFSVFRHKDGSPYIEIVPRNVKVELIDFSDQSIDTRKEKIFAFAIEDSRKSFDIENGPLYRLYLLKEKEGSYYFHGTIHHIIFDGWSRRIFVQDLSRIYLSLLQGVNDNLEPLSFYSYDYAEVEKESLTSKEEDNLISFWKDNLQDCPVELKLPFDYPRGSDPTGLGRRESFELSKEYTSKLRYLSKKGDTTLFNTVLSLLGVLLQKYSGENDICIGVPVSNRRFYPELDKIFGLFINSVVVRLEVNDSNDFNDHVSYTKDVVKKALSHSRLSFERVVEAINPERILGINPLFQVSLSWLTDLNIPMDFGAIKGERVTLPEGISPFDITFYMWEDEETIKGDIEYNIDIFEHDTIVRLKNNLLHLVHSVSDSPDKKLSEISVISDSELEMIEGFNNTGISVFDCLVQNLFEDQALLRPTKTAVISGDSSLTYKELNEKSNQIARYLISLGVTGGDVVGISLDRSVEMVISVLGVLKAGCCYLPMDSSFPDDRLNYMFEDSGAKVLITQSFLKNKFLHVSNTPIILIDTEGREINKHSTKKPEIEMDPQSLAYIIYTSGSTGRPKGVKVHHQAVVNFLMSMYKKPGISNEDRLLGVTTLSFDISGLELFLPLSYGAELVIATTEDILDGRKLSWLLEMNNITVMQATPATWNILLCSGWVGKKNLKALCGGEAILPGLVKDLLPKVETLWNMYGPTETTIWSTCSQITDPEEKIIVGTPIDNTKIFILNKNNKQLPVGVIGEVGIGGLGVTKGYHNRTELTKEKFIQFEEGQIVYKTGDQGRYLEDGNIELFGRIDNQIKLRGFRIEPGEIESLLSGLLNVREVVVKVHRFYENDERLVAFLNVEPEFNISAEEINSILSGKLPPYMIPSYYPKSDGFPRLPNGKVNKKALLYDLQDLDQKHKIDFASLTVTQKKLLTIWGQNLKTQAITLTDNFFNVGGNSLLGVRLINQIREEFGITLTFRDFISNSTISQLGVFIDSQTCDKEEAIELVHLTESTNLPLTINQKRLWLITKLHPDIPSYIIRFTYKFNGSLNREVFEKSLNILFHRHHIVFSIIKEADGDLYCDIVPKEVKVSFIDYTGLPEEEKIGKVKDLINADSGKIFDLEHGPLYRMYLINTSNDEYYFHMSIHHIIFDGWSQGVFANDLSDIYNSLLKGNEIGLEELDFQQYDYAQWETRLENRKESVEFWEENLKGYSEILNFPYDFQRKEQPTGRGGVESIRLTKAQSDSLRKISKEEGSSLFTTMLSAFGILMHKYSGEDDLNIGLPVAYRPHSKLEKIFGMFVNTVVVRLRYEDGATFRALIREANEVAMSAIAHQDLPFESIVEIAKPDRTLNANPLFQVALAWQNNLSVPIKLEGVVSETVKGKARAPIFDITLYLWEDGDVIEGEIEYNMDILKTETIIRLKNHFLTLVNNLIENIDVPVNTVSIISDEEKKMIDDINKTASKYPKEKTISQLFEEEASMFPNHIAISFKEESYTYRLLNEKANQLARTLREYGVRENTPVGILSEKSLEVIIGILGILKSGGAYVPIDTDYPNHRIDFIIEDSGCKLLLTQEKYMELPIKNVKKLNLNSPETYHVDKCNIDNINTSSDLGYIMYTSGSTGNPKGSMISQYSIVRLVRNNNYIDLSANDRILLTSAIVFDVATFEIWGALLNGGSLYIAEKETILNPKALGEELVKNEITILWLTSALFTHIAEARVDIFGKLKYLLVGGDVLSAPHINKVRKANPSLKVINGYGPTENTTFSTTYLIEKDFEHNIPIGTPICNSTAYIFDRHMNYQPIGVVGELYLGGDGVSMGYMNRDDLNKKSFMCHPLITGKRLYRTGDYARLLPDGYIEFHGRVDNQLKIRGFRVELEEIESVISELDGVIETVIKPIKSDAGDIRLAAFLNVSDTFSADSRELSRCIKEKLPSYMVPSVYKFMHGFPKTINGKIERKALQLDLTELDNSRKEKKIKPLTDTEKIIHKLWSEALRTKDISVIDNFFDIGGNSLMAVSIMSRMESAFNIELELKIFFESPKIKDLAEAIDFKIYNIVESKYMKERKEGKAGKTGTIQGEI
jgi:surfactin family lipopeptide synthetase A